MWNTYEIPLEKVFQEERGRIMICPRCKKRWAPKLGKDFEFNGKAYVPRNEDAKKRWKEAFNSNLEELCIDCDEVLSCSPDSEDFYC